LGGVSKAERSAKRKYACIVSSVVYPSTEYYIDY